MANRKPVPGYSCLPVISQRISGVIFYALLLLLVLAPIPFGSNRPWSWSLCALITAVLTLAWFVNAIFSRQRISLSLPPLIIVLFLLCGLWVVLQTLSIVPKSLVHPLWGMSSNALGMDTVPIISLTPDASLSALMRLISYGLIFFLTFQFCRDRKRAKTLLKWLTIAGVVYALYGLVNYWGSIEVFFWIEHAMPANKVSSTFINRNSYVDYAGLGLICLLAWLLSGVSQHTRAPYAAAPGRRALIDAYIINSWKPLLGIMLFITAIVSTQSRGGFIAVSISLAVLLLIYLSRTKLKTKTRLGGIAAVMLIILLAFSVSNDPLMKRLGQTQTQTGSAERFKVYALMLDAIENNPVVGYGYGGFEQSFRHYRSEDIRYIYDKAHNTYLENSFELGIPAAAALFLSLAGAILMTIKGVFRRRRDWGYPAAGVAASALIASHSLLDFGVQIPAIALTYSAIMGMAVAQSFSSVSHKPGGGMQPRRVYKRSASADHR